MAGIMDTLITDRTQADVDRARYLNKLWDPRAAQWLGTQAERAEWEAGPRGAYGYTDFNRVTQAAAYLIGKLNDLGYAVDIGSVTPAYNIRVVVGESGGGTADGTGAYYKGDSATVNAYPDDRHDFFAWMVNGVAVSAQPSYTFVVDGPVTLIAVFMLKQYQVTAATNPPGAGEITGAGTYDIGTTVTVSIEAGDGYIFNHWMENGAIVSDGAEYTFVLESDRNLTAAMTNVYTISVTIGDDGGGTATGGGAYVSGQTVTLSAVAADGYYFNGWFVGGGCISTQEVLTFQATSDMDITAMFKKFLIVTALVDPADGGVVTGGGAYRYLDHATLEVTKINDGYRFVGWRTEDGGYVSSGMSCSVYVQNDETRIAQFFAIVQYTITAVIDPSGTGTITGAGKYEDGATVTLTASPEDGYQFTGWKENGQTVSTNTTYTFTASADRSLIAAFEEKQARLPAGYTELEYILTGPTCGFNTGLNPNQATTSVWMDIEAQTFKNNYEYIFAANTYSSNNFSLRRDAASTIVSDFSTGTTKKISNNIANVRTTIEYDPINKVVKIGSNSYTITRGSAILYNRLYIGMSYSTGKSIQAKIYEAKISVSGTLVRDFIPCKNPSGVVGLYDLVNGAFYSNAWSGSPTAGPAV